MATLTDPKIKSTDFNAGCAYIYADDLEAEDWEIVQYEPLNQ